MKNDMNTRSEKLTELTESELQAVSGGILVSVGRFLLSSLVSHSVRNYNRGTSPTSKYGQSNYSGYKSW